jgi:hypothetical protein
MSRYREICTNYTSNGLMKRESAKPDGGILLPLLPFLDRFSKGNPKLTE